MRPFSTLRQNQQRKKYDKQQQTQNIKDPILETLQDTISTLRTELVHKQKTIDTLMLIIEKITTVQSNVQARLTPLKERQESDGQYQHELQFHQEDLTQQQQLDKWQEEMLQQYVNQEHQLTRSEELL